MKIDLHCHSYYSDDGLSSPEKLIKTALEKRLDGIALTDHNTTKGWPEAIEAAKKLNAVLILGQEIKIKKDGKIIGEVLGYFLKEEINPKGKNIEEIIEEIKKQGGIAIIAHPFHFYEGFKDDLSKYKHLIDGIEVFNSRLFFSSGDKKAFEFAKKNNLAMVAGSDAHHYSNVGDAYTFAQASTLEEFKQQILSKKTKIVGKKSPFYSVIFPLIGKLRSFCIR